jgi:hypothetical protein
MLPLIDYNSNSALQPVPIDNIRRRDTDTLGHGYSNPKLVMNRFFGMLSPPPEGGTTIHLQLI